MEDRASQDLLLVRAILDGDEAAYARLVERYQKMVASVAWRYGTPRQEIEDLVSEVFIKAYGALDRYRPEHPFSTWLYRLAANHVVDHGRKARKERYRVEMPEQLADDAAGAGENVEAAERAKLVRHALGQLQPHYRDVLFLVYVEGLKVDETAATLGVPEGTVKTRLMRGREALRKVLVRENPEHFGG